MCAAPATPGTGWDPAQYERFAAERAQPFHDLLGMVAPCPGGQVVDLGCGTGELTAILHRRTGARRTLAIDSSREMIGRAKARAGRGIEVAEADIGAFSGGGAYDVVFANASLQWLPDHPGLFERLTAALADGGQLAVQVPANADHPSHTIAHEVAHEPPFLDAFAGAPPRDTVERSVLAPERYAELLHHLRYTEQHVRLQVYGHVLPSAESVVEWTKGTTLVRFRRVLPPEVFEAFLDRYRERVVASLGPAEPYFYAFKRVLMWARRPS